MLEKTLKISMLYDFYSQLLTEKQREMIDLYYNQDFSLGEIGEVFGVSRQAVYDTLKRTEKILYEYEEKLKLVALYEQRQGLTEEALEKLRILETILKQDADQSLVHQIEALKALMMKLPI